MIKTLTLISDLGHCPCKHSTLVFPNRLYQPNHTLVKPWLPQLFLGAFEEFGKKVKDLYCSTWFSSELFDVIMSIMK